MTEYAIWRPEYDGHAPPNWKEGMFEEHRHRDFGISWASSTPTWAKDYEYRVSAEALTAPNEDAKPDGWTISGALSIIRAMSPDELAKHGITLAPEKDWATELWADLMDVWDHASGAKAVRAGNINKDHRAAIALIRERVVLKGEA